MVLKVNLLQEYWLFVFVYFSAFFALGYGDCSEPPKLDFAVLGDAFIGKNDFLVNSTVSYSCIPGYTRAPETINSIVCLANSTWSTPEIFCQRKSCGSPGDLPNGEMHAEDFLFGSTVKYTCNTGYNMITKLNYRVCEADGWSNSVPICEVQICQPPNAITDGSYEPNLDEYEYQNSVKYQCNGKPPLALIGDSVLSCTASGNWSLDAPECKIVECKPPNVLNAKTLSGFNGPYYYRHGVTFECNLGFKMNGSSAVECNSNSLWNPPLPTCDRETVTTAPTTSKETTLTKGITTNRTPITKMETTLIDGITANMTPTTKLETTPSEDPNGSVAVIAGKFILTLTIFIMGHVLSNLF